jgi:hypothetical protein
LEDEKEVRRITGKNNLKEISCEDGKCMELMVDLFNKHVEYLGSPNTGLVSWSVRYAPQNEMKFC